MDEKKRISPYSKRLTITVLTVALGATALSITPAMADELELNKGIQFVDVANYVVSAENGNATDRQYTDEVAISDILEITLELTAPEYIKQDETTNITLDSENLGNQQVKWTATKDGEPFELPQGLTNTGGGIDLTEMGQYVITATAVDMTGKEVSTSSIVNVESKFWQITPDGEISPSEKTKINGPYYKEFCARDYLIIPYTFMGITVTKIADNAFYNYNDMTANPIIPNTVTNIGDWAFAGCTNMGGDLTIPEGVTSIGKSAFEDCYGFKGKLTLPKGLQSIGDGAFNNCYFTGDLTIPEGVTSIGNYAFTECNGFNGTLTLPEGLQSIGNKAFQMCFFKGTLTLPESLQSIGKSAFNNCSFTGDLTIPEGITSISNYAFAGSDFNGTLTLPEGLQSIGDGAFQFCPDFTGTLTLPEGLQSIGDSAFYNCLGFTGTLTLPEGLQSICKNTFTNCKFTSYNWNNQSYPTYLAFRTAFKAAGNIVH